MLKRYYLCITVIIIGLLFSCAVTSDKTGIPFTGNHTFDQIEKNNNDIKEHPNFATDYYAGLNKTPSNLSAAIYLGKAAIKVGNASEAERKFSSALKFDRNSREAWRGLLTSLTLQEKKQELLTNSTEVLNIYPLDDGFLLDKAWAYYMLENSTNALDAFKMVSAVNPKNVYPPYYSAWIYQSAKLNQAAIKSFEKVRLLSPQYGGAAGNIGFILISEENYQDAMSYIDQALEWYPNWTEAHRSKGIILMNLNQTEDAFAEWNKALQIDSNYTNTYLSKGEALQTMKKYDEALITIDKGLESSPNNTDLLNLKGDILLATNKSEKALEIFDTVIAMNETKFNYIIALVDKGIALKKLGKIKEADENFSMALETAESHYSKSPDNPYYWDLKRQIYTETGRSQDARVASNKAEELGYSAHLYY
jgi:tetratricopeptide (TPR) repeat protein